MADEQKTVWDRHAIKAEVERLGLTLTSIALDRGLSESACRKALYGIGISGMEALSDALGVPMQELFPHRFRSARLARKHAIRKGSASASQKRGPRAAAARAS
jgi:Ner family transcriptional regulator